MHVLPHWIRHQDQHLRYCLHSLRLLISAYDAACFFLLLRCPNIYQPFLVYPISFFDVVLPYFIVRIAWQHTVARNLPLQQFGTRLHGLGYVLFVGIQRGDGGGTIADRPPILV